MAYAGKCVRLRATSVRHNALYVRCVRLKLRLFSSLSSLSFSLASAAASSPSRRRREIGSLVCDAYARVSRFTAADVFAFSGDHQPDTTRPFFASPGQVSDGRYLQSQDNTVSVRFTTRSVHSTATRSVAVHFDERAPVRAECTCPQRCVVCANHW